MLQDGIMIVTTTPSQNNRKHTSKAIIRKSHNSRDAPQVRPTRNDKDIQTYFLDNSDAPGVRPYSNITTLNTKKHLPKRFQQVFFCYRNPSLCEQQYYQLRRDDSKEHCQRINRRIGYGRSIVVCHLVGISQCRGVGIAT